MEHLTTIITAFFSLISVISVAWFGYNQKTKDKKTDLKIERIKAEDERKRATHNRDTAIIYGEIWHLLHELKADRCFILQPHPEVKHTYLSVVFEVHRKGVSSIKELLNEVPISSIANITKMFATNTWIYFDDIDTQIEDKKAKSLMRLSGATHFAFKQLVNATGDWAGTLAIESTTGKPLDEVATRAAMRKTVNIIQYILPSIN